MSKKSQQRRRAIVQAKDQQRLARFMREYPLEACRQDKDHGLALVQIGAILDILSEGRTAAKAVEVGRNAAEWLSSLILGITAVLPQPPACAPGCCWCCSIPVSVLPPEALVIAAYLRDTLAPDAFAAVCERVSAQAATIAGMTIDTHAEANLPCALLVEGQCSVYPVRPLHCQGWSAEDARECQAAAHDPWQSTVKVVLPILDTSQQVCSGTRTALTMAGVEAQSLELHSALACALTQADAAAQWIEGKRVFADCTPADHGVNPLLAAARIRDANARKEETV